MRQKHLLFNFKCTINILSESQYCYLPSISFFIQKMIQSNVNIQREITPLSQGDCLLVFDRVKSQFDFPVHFHPEYELNFICQATDAERIIGDHKSLINEFELVLVGSNIYITGGITANAKANKFMKLPFSSTAT